MKTRIVQLGMCTADLARTTRRYCEGFGFRDAGGHMMWGTGSARIQGLGSDATGAMWWLVGEQSFFNLEFFRHSFPRQRPLPADWLPNMFGWVKWGFATADFDFAVAYLEKGEIDMSEVAIVDGLRRICIRDPEIGVVVDVMEEGAPRWRGHGNGAGVGASSHTRNGSPVGLPGAKREALVLDGDGVFLEIVQYSSFGWVARQIRLPSSKLSAE